MIPGNRLYSIKRPGWYVDESGGALHFSAIRCLEGMGLPANEHTIRQANLAAADFAAEFGTDRIVAAILQELAGGVA